MTRPARTALDRVFGDRGELVTQYLPYLRAIAAKIARTVSSDIEFDDLVGYGKIGLVEAAQRFDPTRGADFKTFAYYRIRGAIYDGLRHMGWLSPTEYARYKFERGANEFMRSQDERGISAAPRSLSDEVTYLTDIVRSLASIFVVSLDSIDQYEAPDDPARGPAAVAEREELARIVRQALEALPERERKVIQWYYFENCTLREVGERLGLSKSWASRLHSRAIDRLGGLLAAQGVTPALPARGSAGEPA